MTAGTLHCPTCGAPALANANQCSYCGARLAAVGCAKCFGMLFVGSRFCPHCGAPAADRATGDGALLPCPGCRKQAPILMHATRVQDMAMDECPTCAGVWLGHGTFRVICTQAEVRATVLAALGATKRTIAREVRYLFCPVCNQQMDRRNYARQSGVIIDICPAHGLWFDQDELRHVVEFIQSGGLDQARAADEERRKSDAERKRNEEFWLGPPRMGDENDLPRRATPWHATGSLLNILLNALRRF